jgi:hypothetical protein
MSLSGWQLKVDHPRFILLHAVDAASRVNGGALKVLQHLYRSTVGPIRSAPTGFARREIDGVLVTDGLS